MNMIQKITIYPNRHEDQVIQGALSNCLNRDIKKGLINVVFLENVYTYQKLSGGAKIDYLVIDGNVPIFGSENWKLHKQHLELAHQLVSFYDKIKSGQEINRMEMSRVYLESQKVSRQRSQVILENVLEISHEDGYINPAIICGRSHIEKGLKPIFDSEVFTFTLESCQDYIHLFEENKSSDYSRKKFSS